MASSRCNACGKMMSFRPMICPKCGAPIRRQALSGVWLLITAAIALIMVITIMASVLLSTSPSQVSWQ